MKLPMMLAGPRIEKQMQAEVACLDKLKEELEGPAAADQAGEADT